jgi:uncharacterized membrane protein YeiH
VVANEVPQIFNPRGVYAVPAMLGASLVTLFTQLDWFNAYTGTAIAAIVFLLRVLSLRFGWRVPLAGGAKNPSSATE